MSNLEEFVVRITKPGALSALGSSLSYVVIRLILLTMPKEDHLDKRIGALKELIIDKIASSMKETITAYIEHGYPLRGDGDEHPDYLARSVKQQMIYGAIFRDLMHYETSITSSYTWLIYLLLSGVVAFLLVMAWPKLSQIIEIISIVIVCAEVYILINVRKRYNKIKEYERHYG